MIELHKPTTQAQQMTVIRAASGYELSDYEKQKLANVEANAQENKIEAIAVNNQRLPIEPNSKEVNISLGSLAFKSKITSEEFSNDELFFIRCELDDADLKISAE